MLVLNSLEAKKLSPEVKVITPSTVALAGEHSNAASPALHRLVISAPAEAVFRLFIAVTNLAMPGKPDSSLGRSLDSPSLL